MDAPRIGLYGPFGWGNLGDAAIQEAVLASLRRRHPGARFLGISLNPANTTEIHGIQAVPILRSWRPPQPAGAPASGTSGSAQAPSGAGWRQLAALRPLRRILHPLRELLAELRFCAGNVRILRGLDRLLISGGGQISDDWGGPWDHPWSMLTWTLCARLAGTPVSVLSVGAGPVDAPASRRLFFLALRLAADRSVRDEESLQFLRNSGFSLPVQVCADLAFSHPMPERTAVAGRMAVIGLSPMSYFHPQPGVWPDQDVARYERHLGLLEGFARSLIDAGHPVVLFCNQIRSDRHAFDALVARLGSDRAVTAEPTRDLPHLLAQIAGVDIVVTSRLHGVILSFLQSVPVIALSYESKIDAVMRQFGQSEFCLDIDTATPEQLAGRFAALRARRAEISASIASTAQSHRRLLDAQYDRLFGRGEER